MLHEQGVKTDSTSHSINPFNNKMLKTFCIFYIFKIPCPQLKPWAGSNFLHRIFQKLSSSKSETTYQTVVLDKRDRKRTTEFRARVQNVKFLNRFFPPIIHAICARCRRIILLFKPGFAKPSLQAILNLNIARSARPQLILSVPNVIIRRIFMNFQILAPWAKPELRSNFWHRIFWELSLSKYETTT